MRVLGGSENDPVLPQDQGDLPGAPSTAGSAGRRSPCRQGEASAVALRPFAWSPVDFRTVFVSLLVTVCRRSLPGLPCLPAPIFKTFSSSFWH